MTISLSSSGATPPVAITVSLASTSLSELPSGSIGSLYTPLITGGVPSTVGVLVRGGVLELGVRIHDAGDPEEGETRGEQDESQGAGCGR